MLTICCTRFNNNTWEENKLWRERNEYKGCVYNTPVKIKDSILNTSSLFIIEMNNQTNEINGIGFIKNCLVTDKHYKIYSDNNYNRYTYKSSFRIDKEEITTEEMKYIKMLEVLLFTGYKHFKRGHGIQQLPKHILENNTINFINIISNMFKKRFSYDNVLTL
jgi:hypothetical protein